MKKLHLGLNEAEAGWKQKRLGEICHVVGGGTPPRSQPKYWDGNIPWATVKDFTDGSVVLSHTEEHITREGLENSAATLVPENTPVICTRMAVGRCALTTQPIAINQDLKALLLDEDFERTFFIRLLRQNGPNLDRLSIGSTVRGITLADLLALPLRYPERKEEQSRIAAVLHTVDEAIAKTAAVIAKLKQLREGLLHDLLARGLDEHGQLRDPIAHPEQFQDSPLGRIPRSWEIRTCQSLCREIVVGIVVKPASYYVDHGIPALRSANVREDGITLADLVFISPQSNDELIKSVLRAGDVVTVRTGYPGTTCVVPTDLDGANCVDLIISRPSVEIVPEYLALWVNSPFGKDQVLRVQGGLAQQHFNVGEMKSLLVAKPDTLEQREIICRVAEVDTLRKQETEFFSKLCLLKSGLMTDLLTGRVRVPEGIAVAG